jgi:hypothetical protein
MSVSVTGRVHGNTIELDTPVPPLEGKRVIAILEAVDEVELSADEQRAAWTHWVAHAPQGPIEDEADPEFP